MSLTPPQYKQMKQFLVSNSRLNFDKGGSAEKLKNFVNEFKKNNDGKLPTQKQIMDAVGGKSSTIQKYLEEGVDYATRLSKKEAARLGGAPIPKHVVLADDRVALNNLTKKITKLNRVNKLENKGVRFVIRKTQAGNFTPALYYGGYNNKESFGPIEDLKTELNQFKKTEDFKIYDKSKSMQEGGVKSAKTQLKNIGSRKLDVFEYLLNNKNATIEEIGKTLKIPQSSVTKNLQGLYTDIYKRVGDQGAVFLKGYDINQLDSVHDSIKNTKVPLKDRVKNLVIDAYKGDKNLKPLLEKLDNFYTLQNEIKKTPYGKFFAANLDHVVPLNFLRELEKGVSPMDLIRVRPIPEFLNQRAFKAQFDKILGQAYATKNKKALEAIVNLQSYLPKEFGGITPDGKIKDYGAKPFSLKTDLSQTNFDEIYNRVFKFINDPELQPLFEEAKVSFKSLKKQEPNIRKAGIEFQKQYKPGSPIYEKLMKFCPNNLAPGGMAGTCSIDEAITGMKNELAAVRNGSASLGAQSRTANKIKNLGQGGMRAIVKAGLLTDVGLEAAIGFDRFISEGDSPMQALRKSYLTAPLRFSGLMKSPEEGQRDELIKAALDKDKVEFVLDQQELINDRNEAVANLNRLKEQYDNDMLSESFIKDIKKQQQDVLAAKRADLKDMYRSGELSRAEKFITGFQDPQSLKIKDRSYFDALKQAEEKVAAQRGERKFVPTGPIPTARLLEKRIGETVTPDRIKKDMQERFGFTEDETTNLIDSLGGFDKFILDVKNEETARLGGAANMAEGGSIGKKSGPPPESGPNPQGLLSLIKRDIKI